METGITESLLVIIIKVTEIDSPSYSFVRIKKIFELKIYVFTPTNVAP